MPWFRIDDGFANSKPVLRIPRRYRTAAVGLWTLAGTWSAKELTDGFVPEYILDDLAATAAMANQLVRAELWTVAEKDGVKGWLFTRWSTYQPTKVEVLARRAAEAEKKRLAREAKKTPSEQRKPIVSPRDSLGDTSGSPDDVPQGVRSTRPDPTRPVLSLVTSGGELTQVGDCEPPSKCPRHINDAYPPNCPDCKKARIENERWKLGHAELQKRLRLQRRALIDACDTCDENGMVELESGLDHCTHPNDSSSKEAVR